MYKDNSNLQTAPDDTYLFRYMDFISFYSFLRNQTLFFKRLDKYTDQLEGQLFDETITDHYNWLLKVDPYMQKDEAMERATKNAEHIKNFREWTLSNSWNMDHNESYAMWKIYLRGSPEGVAIRTTVGKLKKQLDDNGRYHFSAGKVTYEPLKNFDISQHSVSASKRPPYAYEKEYRALIINQYDSDHKPLFEIGADVDVKPEELIDQIYISPFSSGWFESVVKQLISDKLPNFKPDDIVWSKIQDQ